MRIFRSITRDEWLISLAGLVIGLIIFVIALLGSNYNVLGSLKIACGGLAPLIMSIFVNLP